ncbi:MAG: DUF2971 domain-containing protein [Sideroxydans sp.]|nr:DUF2971 domain-containing protein [Sideroxydans sp.]
MSGFRRYTNLAATIHLLRTRNITLLNPATWDDKNDAYFMAEYKRYKSAETVLALCFAESSETYHHWRVFAHGPDGVCIEFNREKLLAAFARDKRIAHGPVTYKMIKDARQLKSIELEELPFLKRYPYQDECEYRVVYVNPSEALQHKDYKLKLAWINRVTLSPWVPKMLADSVKATVRSIAGCEDIPINRSTLVENESWKALTSRVRGAS